MSSANSGPGQSEVFMRGLSVGSQGTQSGGSINGFPNVAIYLDDHSAQLPGRNLDIYAADMERVEVLEGPQGTLFGAGAQAGAIRYITNKSKLSATSGSVTGGYGITAGGDPNSEVTAVFNLPVIADTLALRGILYNDRHGGYINKCRRPLLAKTRILASSTRSTLPAAEPRSLARSRLTQQNRGEQSLDHLIFHGDATARPPSGPYFAPPCM